LGDCALISYTGEGSIRGREKKGVIKKSKCEEKKKGKEYMRITKSGIICRSGRSIVKTRNGWRMAEKAGKLPRRAGVLPERRSVVVEGRHWAVM